MTSPEVANVLKKYVTSKPLRFGGPLSGNKQTRQNRKDFEELQALALKDMDAFRKKLNDMKAKQGDSHSAVRDVLAKAGLSRHITDEHKIDGDEIMNESYKDKFNAQMKKAGIDSLDDLKTDAEKKAFFKAVDKSHTADHEEVELDEFTRHLTGETVARLMRKYPEFSIFAPKVLRLRTVTRADLEKILPDYISGSDITKLLTVNGKYRGEEVNEENLNEKKAKFLRLNFANNQTVKKVDRWAYDNLGHANPGYMSMIPDEHGKSIEFEDMDDADGIMTKLKRAGFSFTVDMREEVELTEKKWPLDMYQGDGADKLNPMVLKIRKMTDRNDHFGARIELAKIAGDKKLQTAYEGLEIAHITAANQAGNHAIILREKIGPYLRASIVRKFGNQKGPVYASRLMDAL